MNHVLNAKEQAQSLILKAYRQAAEEGLLPSHPFETAPVEMPQGCEERRFRIHLCHAGGKASGHESPEDRRGHL